MFSDLFGSRRWIEAQRAQFDSEKAAWAAEMKQTLQAELQSEIDAFEANKDAWMVATRDALRAEVNDELAARRSQLEEDRAQFEAQKRSWETQTMSRLREQLEEEKRAFETYRSDSITALDLRTKDEMEHIKAKTAALDKKLGHWGGIKAKLESCAVSADTITLNVGGRCFTCAPATLMKVRDTVLSALVSDAFHSEKSCDGKQRTFFIDRDPEVFHLIMTFLRTHGTPFDWAGYRATWSAREAYLIDCEADFYLLKEHMLPPLNGVILQPSHWSVIVDNVYKDRKLLYTCSASEFAIERLAEKLPSSCPFALFVLRLADGKAIGCVASMLTFTPYLACTLAAGSYIFQTENSRRDRTAQVLNKANVAEQRQFFARDATDDVQQYFAVAKAYADGVVPSDVSLTLNLTTKNVSWFIDATHTNGSVPTRFTTLEVWKLQKL